MTREVETVPGEGCNHGTPHLFDRAVPIVIRSWEPRSARLELLARGERVDRAHAATVASRPEIEPPSGAVGGVDLSR